MNKNKHFGLKKLIPCYTDEGRCKFCRHKQCEWVLIADHAVESLWVLAGVVLEPARERYGKPIRVVRAFVCWNKRKKLGLDWEYYQGECVDIRASHGDVEAENRVLAKIIEELGVADEVAIHEGFVHVVYKRRIRNAIG